MKKRFILLFLAFIALAATIPALALSDDDDTTEESTTTATSDEISAMSTALDSLQLYTLGTGLGEYTSTSETITADSITKLISKVESLESSTDPDSATVADATAEIAAARAVLTINMPAAGTFLRIEAGSASGYYMSSSNASNGTNIAFTTDTDASTIFYYDGSTLVSYDTGEYPTYTGSFSASTTQSIWYEGVKDPFGITFSAVTVSAVEKIGYYAVHFHAEGETSLSTSNAASFSVTAGNKYVTGSSYRTNFGGAFGTFKLTEVSVSDALSAKMPTTGLATVYSPVEVSVPDGATPYVYSIDGDGNTVKTQLSITTIPANSGVVLDFNTTEESATATASDDDSDDEIEYMSGQVAAATATGTEYVLSDEGEWTQATAGDELAGFTAYAVAETSYTADDLQTAWDALLGSHVVGDSLGQYTATISGSDTYSDYASLLTAVEELIANTDAESSEYESMISELSSITIIFTLNLPSAGTFLRISSVTDTPYYLTSSNGSTAIKGVYPVATTTERDGAGTIFYYDGTYLLNYETGYYIAAVTGTGNAFASYNGITTGASITFGEGTQTGGYYIKFASRYLYAADNGYTNGGSSYSSDTLYSFYIEEVDTLPVTISNGIATLYSPVALTVPDGVALSTVSVTTYDGTCSATTLSSITTLPANSGVVLTGDDGTYNFIISSETGDEIEGAMSGSYAKQYGTADEYTISYSESTFTATLTSTTDEIGGFAAWGYYDDGIDWDAFNTALTALQTVGDDYHEYHITGYTTDSITTLISEVSSYAKGGSDVDTTKIAAVIAAYETGLEINLPQAGDFLRLLSKGGSTYISSGNGGTRTYSSVAYNCAALVSDGTGAGTIFYYDGTGLLNYETGLYLTTTQTASGTGFLGYNGITTSGTALTFAEGLTGYYHITYNTKRSLYGDTDYVNANSSYAGTDCENWTLTKVTELPVTFNSAGDTTFYAPVATTVPSEGATVYGVEIASYSGKYNKTSLSIEAGGTLPAGTPVMVTGTANETVNFTIDYDAETSETISTGLTGALATILSDGNGYVSTISGDTTVWTLAAEGDTIVGFRAYVAETYDDDIDWDALAELIELLTDRTIGDDYCEYTSSEGYTETYKDSLLEVAGTYDATADPDATTVNKTIAELEALYNSLSINVPEDGSFIRVRSAANNTYANYYLSSEAGTTSTRAAFVASGTGANTIFYYTDNKLLAYETGLYLANTGSGNAQAGYNGITGGMVMSFVEATDGTAGKYNISINGNAARFLCNAAAQTDAGAFDDSIASDTYNRYNYTLEAVSELPITTDANGYTTFYAPVAVSTVDGLTLQEAVITSVNNDGEGTVEVSDLDQASVIPAGVGVLIKATASTTYSLAITDEEGTLTSQMSGQIATALRTSVTQMTLDSDNSTTDSPAFAAQDTIWGFKAFASYVPDLVLDSLTGTYSDDGNSVSFTIAANHSQVMPWTLQDRYLDVWEEPKGYLGKHAILSSASTGYVSSNLLADSLFTYWTSFGAVDLLEDTTPYLIMSCGVYNNLSLSYLWPNDEDPTKSDSVFVARSGQKPNGTYCPYYFITADGWHITDYTVTYRGLTEVVETIDTTSIDTTWTYTTTIDTTYTDDGEATYTYTYSDSVATYTYNVDTVLTTESATCYFYLGDRGSVEYIIPGLNDCDTTIVVSGEEQQIVAFTVETDNGNTSDGVLITSIEVNIAKDADYETHVNLFKTNLYNSNGSGTMGDFQPYRHPAIGGYGDYVLAFAEKAADYDDVLGNGEVNLVYRRYTEGAWTTDDTLGVASSTVSYGNPAVIANFGEEQDNSTVVGSNEVLLLASKWVDGDTVALRTIQYKSDDSGATWTETDITSIIDSLVGGGDTIYVAAGRLMQSRVTLGVEAASEETEDTDVSAASETDETGYYRVYAAVYALQDGVINNYVILTDDFGDTWQVLPGDAAISLDYSAGIGVPKVEELPTGSLVVSSSTTDGRIVNVYTFTKEIGDEGKVIAADTLDGYWSGQTYSNESNNGTSAELASNSDLIIVPAIKLGDTEEENDTTFLALQSLSPAESAISPGTPAELRIYYKDLGSLNGYYTGSRYAADWDGYHRVSKIASGGASLAMNSSHGIDYIFEEENFGPKSDYTIVYHDYSLEEITDSAYTYNNDYVWGTSGFGLSTATSYLDEEMDDYGTIGKYVGQLGASTILQEAYSYYSELGEDASAEDYLKYYEYFHWVLKNLGDDGLIGLNDTTYYVIHSSYATGSGDDYTLNLTYNLYSDSAMIVINDDALEEAEGGRTMYQDPELWRVIDAAGEKETPYSTFRLYNVGRRAYLAPTGDDYSRIELTTDSTNAGLWYILSRELRSGKSTLICSNSTNSASRASLFYNAAYPTVWGPYVSQTQWYIEPVTIDSIKNGVDESGLAAAAKAALAVERGYRIDERTALEEALEAYNEADSLTVALTDSLYAKMFDFYRNSIPTNRFYRFKGYTGNYVVNGTSGSRVAMGTDTLGAIYYYGSDSTMVNYYDGYGIKNSVRSLYENTLSPIMWIGQNEVAFDKFEMYSTDADRYWHDNNGKLDRYSVTAGDSTAWEVTELVVLPVKISTTPGYGTIICPNALQVPDGVEAYMAEANWNTAEVTLTKIESGIIPQNTGVVVKLTGDASDNQYYDFTILGDQTEEESVMGGHVYTHDINDGDDHYILTYKNDSLMFRRATFGTTNYIVGSKPYFTGTLSTSSDEASVTTLAVRFRTIVDETTGVEGIELVFDDDDEPYYDLQGRQVVNPQNGIYIHKGKKIYIK